MPKTRLLRNVQPGFSTCCKQGIQRYRYFSFVLPGIRCAAPGHRPPGRAAIYSGGPSWVINKKINNESQRHRVGRRSLPLSTGAVLHLLRRRIPCRCTSDDEKSSIFFTSRVSALSESAKVSALALSAWQILRTVYRNTLPIMSVKVSSSPASS